MIYSPHIYFEEHIMDALISLGNAFIGIHDPRIDRTKKHKLVDIIMITLCYTV